MSSTLLSSTPYRLAQQYAASKKLLTLSGVHVRQHLFQRPVTLSLSNHPSCPMMTKNTNGVAVENTRDLESEYSTEMVESELESVTTASAMDNGSATKGKAAAATAAGVTNDGASAVDPALEAVLKLWREKSEDADVETAQQPTKTLRFEDI
jgi:hypothetical protein